MLPPTNPIPQGGTRNHMQSAIMSLVNSLATLIEPLSPFAKAVVPAAVALIGAVVSSTVSGSVDATTLTIAGSGLVLAIVAYLVPNKGKAVPPVHVTLNKVVAAPVAPVAKPKA